VTDQRLYYDDPYLREFDGRITGIDSQEGRTRVRLDRTAFYPTSGGQPFDIGTLGELPVTDVFDDEDGSVLHVVDAPGVSLQGGEVRREGGSAALKVGELVHGVVDWRRRFDHMQQHTGQHLLSAAFDRLFAARTVSFHLGAAAGTIDLARELTPSDIAAAEEEANRIVWEDRRVAIRFATADEAAHLPLRKETARTGTLRLIDIDGFDLSACGGTHVARTGEVGIIAVGAWERFKGGLRVEFLCGGRALTRFRTLREIVTGSVRLLSVLPEGVTGAIERALEEAKDHKRTLSVLQMELAGYRAAEMADQAEATPRGRAVFRSIDADAGTLKMLASAVTSRERHLAVLVSESSPALVVIARSPDVDVSAGDLLGALMKTFGGRGGGKPNLAQGGGLASSPQAILAEARRLVGELEP
jgi:alanyl-tRNA synthetase